jgi:hypothetical protein
MQEVEMRVSGHILSLAMLAALALIPSASAARNGEGEALGRTIDRELRAGGPFFTGTERALVARKCGYAPGAWDGFEANISNGVLTCTNGRRVDDAETRAMLRAAAPRIGRRVQEVMARPAVRAAIGRVAEEATAQALREMRAREAD